MINFIYFFRNFEWKYLYLVPGAVVLLIVVVFCVYRRKKRQNKNRRQNINVKDYQPVNSGNMLKPSGMIEKFKIKFFSSFKGCENVKITTMNEEKNNVDGDETSAKVNGDETPAKVSGDETPAIVNGDETPAKVNGDQTPAKVNGDQTRPKLYEAEDHGKLDVHSMLSSGKYLLVQQM